MGTLATAVYAVSFCCSVVSWLVLLAGTGTPHYILPHSILSNTSAAHICIILPRHVPWLRWVLELVSKQLAQSSLRQKYFATFIEIALSPPKCLVRCDLKHDKLQGPADTCDPMLQVQCMASAQRLAYTTLDSPGGQYGFSSSS